MTRDFFEQSPRAARVRNVCVLGLNAARIALQTEGRDSLSQTMLKKADAALDRLGITPAMHTVPSDDPDRDTKLDLIESDPTLSAEWVAGQLRDTIRETQMFQRRGNLVTVEGATAIDLIDLRQKKLSPVARDILIVQYLADAIAANEGLSDMSAPRTNNL